MSGEIVDCPRCSKPIALRLSLSESKKLKLQNNRRSALAESAKKDSALNKTIMNKPTKQNPQKGESRKMAIKKIAAENRAYFEKEDAENENLPPTTKRLDVETLETQVREEFVARWKKNPATSSIQVTSFSLVHEGGNKYVGLFDYINNDQSESLQIIVTHDGRRWIANAVPQMPVFSDTIPTPTQSIPVPEIPSTFNFPRPTGNCPICSIGKLVRMDAGGRGTALAQGNLLGACMNTHQCNYCGHLV